jgi:acetyl esterase/lipase
MMRMRHRALASLSISVLAISLAGNLATAQQTVLPLWPHATPEPAQTTEPEKDVTKPTDALISGHRTSRLTNVTNPTLTVYSPPSSVGNTGAAALVFPGGGYVRLAWDGEGIDTCKWLNSIGVTCVLVKYRVPEKGHYPDNFADLEDAQQAMRLTRAHAAAWHINPAHIGVIGFSAGANLAVLMSTHSDDHHVESTPAAPDVDSKIEARPNFAIVVYPAYLIVANDPKDPSPPAPTLDPVYTPNNLTPTTFLIQAENDRGYGKNAPVYFQALAAKGIPAELHMYATGGHGFGIHPPGKPEENWTDLATAWLHEINMVPPSVAEHPSPSVPAVGPVTPCPTPQPPRPGNPHPGSANPQPFNPDCPQQP